jgi:ABC-type multidrug transport system ATPase subunit
MVRGISGGERKRLSTVEKLMGSQQVLMMDEISTGLDAATLFNIIQWLSAMCRHRQQTTLISMLQPPPETFALFDDLMIMQAGTIVYHGPISKVVERMCSLGFELPPRKVSLASCSAQLWCLSRLLQPLPYVLVSTVLLVVELTL